MFKEISNSIKAILYERAISPLSGAFVGFWIGFNWKPLAIFFLSDDKITDRITVINQQYINIWDNLYYPAIYTIVFLAVYPFVALGPYWLWEKVSNLKHQIKQRLESAITLSIQQSLQIRTEIREKEKEFVRAMESKDLRLDELGKDNQRLLAELSELKKAMKSGTDSEVQVVKLTERLQDYESTINALKTQLQDAINEAKLAKRELQLARRNPVAKITPSDSEESEWREELNTNGDDYRDNLKLLIHSVANNTDFDSSARAYVLAKGLAEFNEGKISMTPKAQYLAKFVY